jgi:tetraacyldisaccharide 4'-kinase
MKAPGFWQEENLSAAALAPLAWGYDALRRLKNHFAQPERVGVPVICIGNFTAGGAGKTPVALWVGEKLAASGLRVWFVSRGYGGSLAGPVVVDAAQHTAREVGDEPLLLAASQPTVVAKDRLAGARLAAIRGAQVIVMDDGLQQRRLSYDLGIAVVDGALGFGNGRLLPAGPLREPVAEGLGRVAAVVTVNSTAMPALPIDKPVFSACTQPVDADWLREARLVAFCGIAYPQKFFATLHNLGGHVLAEHPFADHRPYHEAELAALRREAAGLSATLVTTAKDMARIPPALREGIRVLAIRLEMDEEKPFAELLFRAINRA